MNGTARTRLAPETRRQQILDTAAALVIDEGVSAVTMERLGRKTGVSRTLINNYFGSRSGVLIALLAREQARFAELGRDLIARGGTFEEVVRSTTAAWLDHVAERGALIDRLRGEPELVGREGEHDRDTRQRTIRYFAGGIAGRTGLPIERASAVAELLMGLTGAAGDRLRREPANREQLLDLVMRLLFAAIENLTLDQANRVA